MSRLGSVARNRVLGTCVDLERPKGHCGNDAWHYMDKVYETTLLRSSYRVGGKVDRGAGQPLLLGARDDRGGACVTVEQRPVVEAGEGWEVERSFPYGHVAAVGHGAGSGPGGTPGPPLVGRHHPGRGRRVAGVSTDDVE